MDGYTNCPTKTLPACDSDEQFTDRVGKAAGFSLHAGVATKAHERDKLERLCRYIARPAISEKRLCKVRYELKTPYRDGTTHVIFAKKGLALLSAAVLLREERFPVLHAQSRA